ncbi:hypothetical protein A264_11450 [Pseudomonas syringae pv. actinidiae ICMP 19071]|nr:hypothetical protein A264_11450 [Pseudomonas syringae pv. actinidiae ICMP 19071]EPM74093.1 hypothetical protein A3SO_27168 [Pseudomonas syringae pv. actinidiae ICMP 19072]OSN77197.1 hypothetical protein BV351_02298 [Pseudomonas syringae pv. actinidiae]RMS11365.1 hypothetical protein ALP75_200238 [Pseudomonas syringae pv. actinidiae]
MNVRTALTLSAVFMLSLTGCATRIFRPSPMQRHTVSYQPPGVWLCLLKGNMTMNVRTALTLSAVFMLSLTGCATQSQVDRQTNQLEVISASLKQIQANQQQSIDLQKLQADLQQQSNNEQAFQRQAGGR